MLIILSFELMVLLLYAWSMGALNREIGLGAWPGGRTVPIWGYPPLEFVIYSPVASHGGLVRAFRGGMAQAFFLAHKIPKTGNLGEPVARNKRSQNAKAQASTVPSRETSLLVLFPWPS